MRKLVDSTALVTGASSGIGRAIAIELARRGSGVVLVARRKERLEALADEVRTRFGVHAEVEVVDLSRPEAPEELVRRREAADIQVDILVNNAGFGIHRAFLETPWERQRAMLSVNVVALTELTRLLVPPMVARGTGKVMNVASIGAYLPVPGYAVYASAKAYVRNFTEALDAELSGTGVRAIAISPGSVRTEFLETAELELNRVGDLLTMSAERCASIAVTRMLGGRRTLVPGYLNALGMWLLRFVPRRQQTFFGWLAMGATANPGPSHAESRQ